MKTKHYNFLSFLTSINKHDALKKIKEAGLKLNVQWKTVTYSNHASGLAPHTFQNLDKNSFGADDIVWL